MRNYTAAAAQVEVLESTVLVPARENRQLLEAAYREGKVGLPVLLLIRNQVIDAEQEYWSAWLAEREALAALAAATGDNVNLSGSSRPMNPRHLVSSRTVVELARSSSSRALRRARSSSCVKRRDEHLRLPQRPAAATRRSTDSIVTFDSTAMRLAGVELLTVSASTPE